MQNYPACKELKMAENLPGISSPLDYPRKHMVRSLSKRLYEAIMISTDNIYILGKVMNTSTFWIENMRDSIYVSTIMITY